MCYMYIIYMHVVYTSVCVNLVLLLKTPVCPRMYMPYLTCQVGPYLNILYHVWMLYVHIYVCVGVWSCC
jgi:hypothetical protein